MTNFEYWKSNILEMCGDGLISLGATKDFIPIDCTTISCEECAFVDGGSSCLSELFKWLYDEYKI